MQRQFSISLSYTHFNNCINFIGAIISSVLISVVITESGFSQYIVYDQYDIIENYDTSCQEKNISLYTSISCTEEIENTFNILPVRYNYIFNSGFARSYNDGPTWQGKGSNVNVGLGFSGRFGNLTYVINPILHWRENRPFDIGAELSNRVPFQYPFIDRIDYVSRYGNDSAFKFYFGQSEVRYNLKNFDFSISTQNMRWGPAVYNPIVMSANAQGIPHFRIGTKKALSTFMGNIEANVLWGYLEESDYFNDDPEDNIRYFTGMTLGYQPAFFDKLSIGFNRIFHAQTRFLPNEPIRNTFLVFSQFFPGTNVRKIGDSEEVVGNDAFDQILSLTFTYHDKSNDFKAYLEWARGDFAGGITSLVIQPEHNSGHTAGFVKTSSFFKDLKIRFIYEHSSLAVWETSFIRSSFSLYAHGLNIQGYTNNGQIIGAGIGPGSSADYLNISILGEKSTLSLEYQRIRFNDDYFFTNFTSRIDSKPHDLEHQFGIIYDMKREKFDLRLGIFQSLRYSYLYRDGIDGSEIFNSQANFTIKYKL